MEHHARKSRPPPPPPPPPTTTTTTTPQCKVVLSSSSSSSQRHGHSSDVDDADSSSSVMEQFRLDDMYVIDSAGGEYSVSDDDQDDRRRASNDRPVSSDRQRPIDFELFLSYLRSVDCNFQEVVSTFGYRIVDQKNNSGDDSFYIGWKFGELGCSNAGDYEARICTSTSGVHRYWGMFNHVR